MAISSQTVDITPTSVYTSTGESIVSVIYLCNTGAGPLTFNVHLVPSGNVPDSTNLIYWAVNLTTSDTYVIDTEKLILDDGDFISVQASALGMVATVCYIGA